MGRYQESVDALLDEHESALLAYAHLITGGDSPLAHSLLEHALVVVFSRRKARLNIRDAEHHIRHTIATAYLARDRRRQRRLAARQLFRPHDWIPPAALADAPDALFGVLRCLGPRERVCLIRYILDARTIEEVAHELALPVERARACLRDSLSLIEEQLGLIGEVDLDTVPVLGQGVR